MNAITTAYNYYMTTYAPKRSKGSNSAHKPGELKDVYNSIVKQNKESPTYLYDRSKSVYKYAISIKEEAIGLKDALTALTNESDPNSIIGRKIANSTQPDKVAVSYTGTSSVEDDDLSYDIEVSNLAKQQINTGKYLKEDALNILPNDYSFELQTPAATYEFQFHISHNDTNYSIQSRLSNLINNSDIGVTARVLKDSDGNSALEISSKKTGSAPGEDSLLIDIFAQENENTDNIVKYLGIHNVTQMPMNAHFTLNNEQQTSDTNKFSINSFEIDLKDITEPDTPVHIDFKTDTDTIAENIKLLVAQYNSMVDTSGNYVTDNKVQSHSLSKDFYSITSQHHNNLESIGLNIEDSGKIAVEDSLLYQALEEDSEDTVQIIFNFKNALVNKTDKVLLNPMNYVNRTIVTYKNPGKSFVNPYVTSEYSGMLFNSYC